MCHVHINSNQILTQFFSMALLIFHHVMIFQCFLRNFSMYLTIHRMLYVDLLILLHLFNLII
jgi:hypothetical protein